MMEIEKWVKLDRFDYHLRLAGSKHEWRTKESHPKGKEKHFKNLFRFFLLLFRLFASAVNSNFLQPFISERSLRSLLSFAEKKKTKER
jgi:hypothetical protein